MQRPAELFWSPDVDDPAFMEGYYFVERNMASGDGFHGLAPWWYGWMVRQAFWCGAKWARENARHELSKERLLYHKRAAEAERKLAIESEHAAIQRRRAEEALLKLWEMERDANT